jgi:hypothetical protein
VEDVAVPDLRLEVGALRDKIGERIDVKLNFVCHGGCFLSREFGY